MTCLVFSMAIQSHSNENFIPLYSITERKVPTKEYSEEIYIWHRLKSQVHQILGSSSGHPKVSVSVLSLRILGNSLLFRVQQTVRSTPTDTALPRHAPRDIPYFARAPRSPETQFRIVLCPVLGSANDTCVAVDRY